jgi:hypothetical protein
VPLRPGADDAAQVDRAHSEVVDTDLGADAGGPAAADGEG